MAILSFPISSLLPPPEKVRRAKRDLYKGTGRIPGRAPKAGWPDGARPFRTLPNGESEVGPGNYLGVLECRYRDGRKHPVLIQRKSDLWLLRPSMGAEGTLAAIAGKIYWSQQWRGYNTSNGITATAPRVKIRLGRWVPSFRLMEQEALRATIQLALGQGRRGVNNITPAQQIMRGWAWYIRQNILGSAPWAEISAATGYTWDTSRVILWIPPVVVWGWLWPMWEWWVGARRGNIQRGEWFPGWDEPGWMKEVTTDGRKLEVHLFITAKAEALRAIRDPYSFRMHLDLQELYREQEQELENQNGKSTTTTETAESTVEWEPTKGPLAGIFGDS